MGFSHYVVICYPNKELLKILSWKLRMKEIINCIKNYIRQLQHMPKVYMIVESPINKERSIILGLILILVDIHS